jgi:methylthioribose-1-phosphate isomerase
VLARHHGIPFYVALPATTLDRSLTAEQVPIEERDEGEVREVAGRRLVPDEAAVWNPAFDVTPPELVTALVTDAGVIRPPYGPRLADLAQP